MPMAASAIYFLNLRGDVLINRLYRDDVGNANVACAFKFVVEAVALFKSYFGGAFDEDAIHNNFVLIYELLDEIMDFGYPQNLSPEILKLYITQEGVRSPFSSPHNLYVRLRFQILISALNFSNQGFVNGRNGS
ncbi:hypothetical protein V6N13_131497 [Hibiscus sabdariffa]